jgi:biopolymer transport protein ExbB/TolQ
LDAVKLLENYLYVVSEALYLPVIAAVSALLLYCLWHCGTLSADALIRFRRGSPEVRAFKPRLLEQVNSRAPHIGARVERLLQEAELEAVRRLDRVRFVIKVGPALGLMGTLIPMGISLAALAEGNVPKMAGSMVTAFTATVAGLACGVLAYMIALVREKWARADIREMEYLAETNARLGAPVTTELLEAPRVVSQT